MLARSRVRVPTVPRVASSDEATRARDERTIARALGILERRACEPGQLFGDVSTCGAFFRLRLGNEVREHFEAAFLDTQHRLIAVERLFSGSVDSAEVRPRIVVQRALALNAAAVLLAHNHPSGDPTPSRADEALTQTLKTALAMLDIRLLDHFIVTPMQVLSLAEQGLV